MKPVTDPSPTILCALNSADDRARSMLEARACHGPGEQAVVCEPPVARLQAGLSWVAVLPDRAEPGRAFGLTASDPGARLTRIHRPDFPGVFCAFIESSGEADLRLTTCAPPASGRCAILWSRVPARLADAIAHDPGLARALREAAADILLAAATGIEHSRLRAMLETWVEALPDWAEVPLLLDCANIARKFGFHAADATMRRTRAERAPGERARIELALALARASAFEEAEAIARAIAIPDSDAGADRHRALLDEFDGRRWIASALRAIARAPPRSDEPHSKRIAYCLHNALPHMSGGYAIRSHGLALALQRSGSDIVALVRPGFPSDSPLRAADAEPIETIDGVEYHFDNSFGRRGRLYGYLAEATTYYAARFAELDIGLVHAATNHLTALPAGLAAHRLGLPFVYEVRSFWSLARDARAPEFGTSFEARRDDLLESATLALANRVMTLTDGMRDHLASLGVATDNVDLVHNAVDPVHWRPRPRDPALAAAYGIAPDDVVIGYVGAMVGYEGVTSLVDAAAPLLRARADLKLLIVGADPAARARFGTVEHAIAERIEALAIADQAVLLPRVPRDRVADVQALIDICAYPRLPLAVCELVSPLKPLEAMAMGKAVIVSSVGGMREMVRDGETGLVFAKGDTRALAEGLALLAGDAALRARLGAAARAFVIRQRDWEGAAQRMQKCYALARDAWCDRSERAGEILKSVLNELFPDLHEGK